MSDQVYLIGLDGATWRNLESWVDSGDLPTFSRLVDEGVHGRLNSTIPSKTCPAVPALYTGRNPAQLGLFDFTKPDGSSVSSNDIDHPKLWSVLDDHDIESCIVNLRVTYPPDSLKGLMITGFPTPDEESPYTKPPELKQRVHGFQFDEETAELRRLTREPYVNAERILEIRKEILQTRWATFRELSEEAAYGLNVFWVGGTDFLQHWLWDDEDTLLAFYREVDSLLGELRDEVDAPIFIVSDHGFEPRAENRFHVNEWLRRNGWLSVRGGAIGNKLLGVTQGMARRYLPPKYLQRILRVASLGERDGAGQAEAVIDRTMVNVPGISPKSQAVLATRWGIDVDVDRGRYETVCDDIIEGLRSLQTEEGEPMVKEVWHRDEFYSGGQYLDEIPDIIFQPATGFYPEAQLSNSLVTPRVGRTGTQDGRTFNAEHEGDRQGIIIAHGESIAADGDLDADICDVAPTVLHLLGVPVPDSMSGEVILDAFSQGSEPREREPRFQSYLVDGDEGRGRLTHEDDAELKERLEDMGYL